MRYHSIYAHRNNTFTLVDGLWRSATGENYGWDDSALYPCSASPVPNYGPQDHSVCGKVVAHPPVYRTRGIDTDAAEAFDYAHED